MKKKTKLKTYDKDKKFELYKIEIAEELNFPDMNTTNIKPHTTSKKLPQNHRKYEEVFNHKNMNNAPSSNDIF